MKRWRVLSFLAAWLLLWLCFSSAASALPDAWKASFAKELRHGVKKNWKYVWGGKDPRKPTYDTKAKAWRMGVDCQGFILFSAKRAGIPGVGIVTSRDMARGLGGWAGVDLDLGGLHDETDIVWWTLTPDRPLGHVGAYIRNPFPAIAHASGSRGVVADEVKGRDKWPSKGIKKVRRLTIGDKK